MKKIRPKILTVTKRLVAKLKCPTLQEGGFQRKLNKARAYKMNDAFCNGYIAPPIKVAKIGRDLLVFDGQHTLFAWGISPFPLLAIINSMTKEQAIQNFVANNSKGVRVHLGHRLIVDPGEFADRLRRVAKKYAIEHSSVYAVLVGLTKGRIKKTDEAVGASEWQDADTILRAWKNDKRWKKPGNLYNQTGTFHLVGRCCAGRESVFHTAMCLKKLDYRWGSEYAMRYAGSGKNLRHMLEYINDTVLKSDRVTLGGMRQW